MVTARGNPDAERLCGLDDPLVSARRTDAEREFADRLVRAVTPTFAET
ncbi:hypothetical protein ACIHFC_00370 [Streptomyces sp. NPDC052013]